MKTYLKDEQNRLEEKKSRTVLKKPCCCGCKYPVYFVPESQGGGHKCGETNEPVATAMCFAGVEIGQGKHPCARCKALLEGGSGDVHVADATAATTIAGNGGGNSTSSAASSASHMSETTITTVVNNNNDPTAATAAAKPTSSTVVINATTGPTTAAAAKPTLAECKNCEKMVMSTSTIVSDDGVAYVEKCQQCLNKNGAAGGQPESGLSSTVHTDAASGGSTDHTTADATSSDSSKKQSKGT